MIKNAKQNPKVYYGLHFVEGVAEYREQGKDPYRIVVRENTIKNMDPSFEGRPVFVDHVAGVDLENIQVEADGYVVESFFNQSDGRHWCKFIVVSDRAHEAIRNGWRLSNAYIPKSFGNGGLWHGVEYDKEVTSGEYEHLAIVRNPRYEESVILTPEQFKEYNGKKELELKRLSNSKEKKVGLLNLFKKEKIENSADLEQMSVVLPKSKKEVTIAEAVGIADTVMNMHGYANPDHLVKVGEEEMSVNDLVNKYGSMMAKHNADEADAKKKEEEEKKKKENMSDEEKKAEEVKKNAADEQAKKDKELKDKNFNDLKDAPFKNNLVPSDNVDLSADKVARGKARYGSK